MEAIKVMTFGEFLEMAEKSTRLIYPHDEETRCRNEIGVIIGWNWMPVVFSDKALDNIK